MMGRDDYHRDVEDLIKRQNKDLSICPFDGLPCEYVSSCDDVMALTFGLVLPFKCSRAVVKVRK